MGLGKKTIRANIGRFVQQGDKFFFVDNREEVWTQEQIADLIDGWKQHHFADEMMKFYAKKLKK